MVIVGRIRSQVKARTIRKLTGGGGWGGEVQKKYSHKGKLNEKIHARQLILKKY